jgi:hypothetical protein
MVSCRHDPDVGAIRNTPAGFVRVKLLLATDRITHVEAGSITVSPRRSRTFRTTVKCEIDRSDSWMRNRRQRGGAHLDGFDAFTRAADSRSIQYAANASGLFSEVDVRDVLISVLVCLVVDRGVAHRCGVENAIGIVRAEQGRSPTPCLKTSCLRCLVNGTSSEVVADLADSSSLMNTSRSSSVGLGFGKPLSWLVNSMCQSLPARPTNAPS